MNSQVDIIIIGDSKDGNYVLKKLAKDHPKINIAFISREFKKATTHDFLNVEYIKDEVIFTDYKNRLFCCYLKTGKRVYCTHLIFAAGLAYEPLILNNKQVPCVFNNIDDIEKSAKNQPAVVICDSNSDVKFALNVAKKYKHIYLCTKNLTIEGITETNTKKLADAENIVILPNTSILKATIKENVLHGVELDNYSKVTCSAIYVKTNFTPETNFVSDKLINKDEQGYLKTSDDLQSLLVPKCFAVGNCAVKSKQKMKQKLIETVLKDFIGGN